MSTNLEKFIPSELRIKFIKKIVNKTGIRPLARNIGVNPKSVYKYKEGESSPRDEVMAKILAVSKREYPEIFEDHKSTLKEDFLQALDETLDPDSVLDDVSQGSDLGGGESSSSVGQGETSVDQGGTESGGEGSSVGSKSTGSVSLENLYGLLDVKNPFDKSKVRKITNTLNKHKKLSMEELLEQTGLSEEAVERYSDLLIEKDIIRRKDSGDFELIKQIEGGG